MTSLVLFLKKKNWEHLKSGWNSAFFKFIGGRDFILIVLEQFEGKIYTCL